MPANPAAELKQLTEKLATIQAKSVDLLKEIDRTKVQITDLTKTVSDIDAKSKGYDKASQTSAQQKADVDAYIASQKTTLEATVSNKDDIVKAKAAALVALDGRAKTAQDTSAEAAKKKQAWVDAKANAAAKQAEYDNVAALSAKNEAVLTDLSQLRAAADKDGAVNNVGRKYFQVLVMEDVVKRLQLPTSAEFANLLKSAASDLAAADAAELLAKDTADQAVVDAQQAQKDLDSAKSGWRQQVLESIPPGNTPGMAATTPYP